MASSPPQRRREVLALDWRSIRDPAQSGSRNMALDHALALSESHKGATLRLYSWERPTVSFGRNEPAAGLYSERMAHDLGLEYVRRPTGGRAVLHDNEVTYAVVAPVRSLGGARVAYKRINQALASALQSLGAPVELGEAGSVLPLDAGPCFQSPADGEVVAGGRKLVGSAQVRIGGMLLQHGSILLAGDQALLGDLCDGAGEHQAPSTLAEVVGRAVSPAEVEGAVVEYMEREFGGDWSPGAYDAKESACADALDADRYGTQEWVWRR